MLSFLVQFLVCFRETMIQAKVVGPGRRAECLRPLYRLLQVALESPVPSTDAALYMPALAHDFQESLDVLFIDQIFDLYHYRSASRLQMKRDCRGVESSKGSGSASRRPRSGNRTPAPGTSSKAPAEPSSAQARK